MFHIVVWDYGRFAIRRIRSPPAIRNVIWHNARYYTIYWIVWSPSWSRVIRLGHYIILYLGKNYYILILLLRRRPRLSYMTNQQFSRCFPIKFVTVAESKFVKLIILIIAIFPYDFPGQFSKKLFTARYLCMYILGTFYTFSSCIN